MGLDYSYSFLPLTPSQGLVVCFLPGYKSVIRVFEIVFRFPSIVLSSITLPSYKVFIVAISDTMVHDLFDLMFFLALDEDRFRRFDCLAFDGGLIVGG